MEIRSNNKEKHRSQRLAFGIFRLLSLCICLLYTSFLKNMTVYSRLDLYSDYLHKPQNIDVNWEVQILSLIHIFLLLPVRHPLR